jgi:hypothetical protein
MALGALEKERYLMFEVTMLSIFMGVCVWFIIDQETKYCKKRKRLDAEMQKRIERICKYF